MGKRIQYTGTTEEKQTFCAFRTDFGTKRYVYPLSFAQQIPQGDANPLRRYRASSPEGGAFTHLPVSADKVPPSGELARRQA